MICFKVLPTCCQQCLPGRHSGSFDCLYVQLVLYHKSLPGGKAHRGDVLRQSSGAAADSETQ